MSKCTTVSAFTIDCADLGHGPFEVLVIAGLYEGDPVHNCYLHHADHADLYFMFSADRPAKRKALVEYARTMAEAHIPRYIKTVINKEA